MVNNEFLTAQNHVGHDCQVWGDLVLDIKVFTSNFVRCLVLVFQALVHNKLI